MLTFSLVQFYQFDTLWYSQMSCTVYKMLSSSRLAINSCLLWQCQCYIWYKRGSHDDDRPAYRFRYLLCWLWVHCWMEIRKILWILWWLFCDILCIDCPSSKLYGAPALGGCTWEEPEVQGRKVYFGEVTTLTNIVWWCSNKRIQVLGF